MLHWGALTSSIPGFVRAGASEKIKTLAFGGKQPVRTKIVIDGKIMEQQVQNFNYLGCYVIYGTEIDVDGKLNKFRNIYGTIHTCLKNKTRKK